jgi:hypothetical protein
MRRSMRRSLAIVVASLVLGGCYRVTVTSGPQPTAAAPPTVVDVPFSHSFVYGLVPPPEVNVRDKCPSGVAKVETQHSFVNGLVTFLTWYLYTPIRVTVTCAP